MDTNFSLPEIPSIPDLSGFGTPDSTPFVDGWYEGTIVEQRTSTDRNGNERTFASEDVPSTNGDSRNVKLQVIVKRQSDERTANMRYMVNYRPSDLTAETVAAVVAQQAKVKSEGAQWDDLFRPFVTLQRLHVLQDVAGVRQFQRNGNGGLEIHGLFGKTVYVRLAEDDRDNRYKMIKAVSATPPKKAPIL